MKLIEKSAELKKIMLQDYMKHRNWVNWVSYQYCMAIIWIKILQGLIGASHFCDSDELLTFIVASASNTQSW